MRTLITKYTLFFASSLLVNSSFAAMEDDPLLFMLKADQLELRDTDEGTATAWEGHLWFGKDLDKIWIKTEGERVDSEVEEAEIQLLYGHAIDPNWDIQLGIKHDAKPEPTQDWAVVGFYGVAPYFIEVDSALFIGEDGQTSLRFEAEYEMMLTQQWALSPEIEINAFGKDDDERGIGAGLSNLEAGLRLRYEFTREFAPYIGIHHEQLLGGTQDIAEDANAETSESSLVVGVHFWF